MAITASVQPESGRIVYAGSNFPHPFQLPFSKKGMDHILQNRLGSDLGTSDQGTSGLTGSKPVCRNHLARFLAGRNRPATSFPLSDSVAIIRDVPDNAVQNQPGSDSVLADCAGFWPNGCPEVSQCAKIIRPTSDQYFPTDPARMRIGSGMFTGTAQTGLWGRS